MTSPAQQLMKWRNFHVYSRRRYNDDDEIFGGGVLGFLFLLHPQTSKKFIFGGLARLLFYVVTFIFLFSERFVALDPSQICFLFLPFFLEPLACVCLIVYVCTIAELFFSFDDFFTPDLFFLCAQNPVVFCFCFFIPREKRKKRSGINLSHPLSLSAVISSRNFPLDNRKRREKFTKRKRKMREIKLSRRHKWLHRHRQMAAREKITMWENFRVT